MLPGPPPVGIKAPKGSDLHPEKQAHATENEKGEACPPLQLEKGEQRHRGACSSILGPGGGGVSVGRGATEGTLCSLACPRWCDQEGPLGFTSACILQTEN